MKLDSGAFALAAGIVAAALSALCAAFVALAPETATALASAVVHLDLTSLARPVTPVSFLGGVVFWGALTAIVFGTGASLYNRFSGARTARAEPVHAGV
ncbi:MAG: hypothetical protein HY701_04525 [Gemmatimonadetes bacterium]|nr:hypothetical protein [Gemmatimonadota bacterium]